MSAVNFSTTSYLLKLYADLKYDRSAKNLSLCQSYDGPPIRLFSQGL